MSALGGLLFLAAWVGVVALGIAWMVARERSSLKPRRTVASFETSSVALRRIFREHVQRREAARAKARASHPSSRPRSPRRDRRSA